MDVTPLLRPEGADSHGALLPRSLGKCRFYTVGLFFLLSVQGALCVFKGGDVLSCPQTHLITKSLFSLLLWRTTLTLVLGRCSSVLGKRVERAKSQYRTVLILVQWGPQIGQLVHWRRWLKKEITTEKTHFYFSLKYIHLFILKDIHICYMEPRSFSN